MVISVDAERILHPQHLLMIKTLHNSNRRELSKLDKIYL